MLQSHPESMARMPIKLTPNIWNTQRIKSESTEKIRNHNQITLVITRSLLKLRTSESCRKFEKKLSQNMALLWEMWLVAREKKKENRVANTCRDVVKFPRYFLANCRLVFGACVDIRYMSSMSTLYGWMCKFYVRFVYLLWDLPVYIK